MIPWFDEEEQALEVDGEAVAGALGQAVRLVPDYLVPQYLAALNHPERKARRQLHQALAGKPCQRAFENESTVGRC